MRLCSTGPAKKSSSSHNSGGISTRTFDLLAHPQADIGRVNLLKTIRKFRGVLRASNLFKTATVAGILSVCFLSNVSIVSAETGTSTATESTSARGNLPYQRLDFQVKASCVTCLRKVAKALKATRGVVSADVSIYYPHWAVVIIDTAQTDDKKIIARVAKEKANIDKLIKQDLKDKPILVVPRSDVAPRL